jgi:ankyrin repeat protein
MGIAVGTRTTARPYRALAQRRGGAKVSQMSGRDANAELRAVLDKVQSILQFTDVPIENVNQRGMFGDTPLHVVTNWGDLHSVGVLLDAGADVNAKGEDGYTPLHCATSRGHREIVKLLLERGASTDIRNDEGRRPVDIAVARHRDEIAGMLEAHAQK